MIDRKLIKFEGDNLAPEVLPQPCGWRILVGMINIPEKSEGGIILTNQVVRQEQHFRHIAKVLSVGDVAYQDPKFQGQVPLTNGNAIKPWVQVGDIVFIDRNGGKKLEFEDAHTGQICALKLVNDDDILAIIPDPAVFII